MLSKIFKFFQDIEDESRLTSKKISKIHTKDANIIEVSDLLVSSIPHKQIINKPQVTNESFAKIINRLGPLTQQHNFYLNKLEIYSKKAFLNNEFFEIEVVKLYLDLCIQVDIYLKSQGTSLKKKMSKRKFEYYNYYNNTLQTLFYISEFTIEEYYYGRSAQDINFSYHLLQQQINKKIGEYLKQYIELRLQNLPKISTELNKQINEHGSNWHTIGFMYKRLGLDSEQKKFFELLSIQKNAFLEINQALDETATLYLKIITFLNTNQNIESKPFLKTILVNNWEKCAQSYGSYKFQSDEKVKKFLESLFRIAENNIRLKYEFGRLLDIKTNKQYVSLKCGRLLSLNLEYFLENYTPQNQTTETFVEINSKNKTKWKEDLKIILETETSPIKLIQRCNELVEKNQKNSSLHLIYFELCKHFAKIDKTTSCWFYFKYYKKVLPDKPKELPDKMKKLVFENDEKKMSLFKFIVIGTNPLKPTEEDKKLEIENLFITKRKEIKLNLNEINQTQETHQKLTQTLNQVLQNQSENVVYEQNTNVNNTKPTSVQDFFDEN